MLFFTLYFRLALEISSYENYFNLASHYFEKRHPCRRSIWDLKIKIPKDLSSKQVVIPGSLSIFLCQQ